MSEIKQEEKEVFGTVQHIVPKTSSRSINTYFISKAPRFIEVLKMLQTYPERRHVILVNDIETMVLLANLLTTRTVIACLSNSERPASLRNEVVTAKPDVALRSINEGVIDTLIFLRNQGVSGFRITDPKIVLSSVVDLTEAEAVQFAHRYRPRMVDPAIEDPEEEDVRLCIFLNARDSRPYIEAAYRERDPLYGIEHTGD